MGGGIKCYQEAIAWTMGYCSRMWISFMGVRFAGLLGAGIVVVSMGSFGWLIMPEGREVRGVGFCRIDLMERIITSVWVDFSAGFIFCLSSGACCQDIEEVLWCLYPVEFWLSVLIQQDNEKAMGNKTTSQYHRPIVRIIIYHWISRGLLEQTSTGKIPFLSLFVIVLIWEWNLHCTVMVFIICWLLSFPRSLLGFFAGTFFFEHKGAYNGRLSEWKKSGATSTQPQVWATPNRHRTSIWGEDNIYPTGESPNRRNGASGEQLIFQ